MFAPLAAPPPLRAIRLGGALYLVIIVAGILGPLLTRTPLVVDGDVTATARNIAASSTVWRLGIATDVVMQLCDVPVMLVLFLLLRRVNEGVALMALLFNVVQTAMLVANQLTLVAADLAARDEPALAALAIEAYSAGEALGLAFFGFALLAVGYLLRKSGFAPRALGLLVQAGGAGYVLNSLIVVVAPDVATIVVLIPSFIAEVWLATWLLARPARDPAAAPATAPHP
jgi:hypothetical protein